MKNVILSLIACLCLALFSSLSLAQCQNCPNGQCPLAVQGMPSAVPQPRTGITQEYLLQYRNDQAKILEQVTAGQQAEIALLQEILKQGKQPACECRPGCPCGPNCPCPAVTAPAAPALPPNLEAVKEKADALLESPFAKHIAAFLLVVGLVLEGHAVYTKCHADRKKIDAKLSPDARKAFDDLDDFNTKLHNRLFGIQAAVEKKADNADLVKVALATPAPAPVAPPATK